MSTQRFAFLVGNWGSPEKICYCGSKREKAVTTKRYGGQEELRIDHQGPRRRLPKEPDKDTQRFLISSSTPMITLPAIHIERRLTQQPNPQSKAPELISHHANESRSIQLNFHGNRPRLRYVKHRSYPNRYGLKMASTEISVTRITGERDELKHD